LDIEPSTDKSQPWPWAEALDALVAAPHHHRLLFENEHVRVLEVRIPCGHTVPVHTHRWPSVVQIRSASDFLRRDEAGKLIFDSRVDAAAQSGSEVAWTPPLPPHSVENVGTREIHLLAVELKHAAE
jgi:hypothetical protein